MVSNSRAMNDSDGYETKAPAAGDLKRILLKLRKDGRFYQALQVYEWMRKKGIYKLSSSDYAVQFNLICKVRGRSAAVHYAKNLPKQARNDKTGNGGSLDKREKAPGLRNLVCTRFAIPGAW
ncbi:unnamed protein product [Cuscuta campestris]|uniref:Pentacotripeptide-repeat region of PRORP domain-containing protein n=1 Tax=Cuscuta campestris TaxID=132261 RepID=A0A484M4N2_9ASTE|nr:unnamed protein product [Cuscuta campestris]